METQSDKNKSQDPVQQWLSARREALVEVKNYDGKSVMVSRSALIKSQNTREESCRPFSWSGIDSDGVRLQTDYNVRIDSTIHGLTTWMNYCPVRITLYYGALRQGSRYRTNKEGKT